MASQIALALRVLLLYPLAGLLAALPSVSYDTDAAALIVDVNGLSMIAGAVIWAVVSGGTFGWSRWVKAIGGAV